MCTGKFCDEIAGIEVLLTPGVYISATICYDVADGFIRDADEWDVLAVACDVDPRIYCRTVDIGDGFFHHEYYYCAEGWRIHPAVR